MNPPDPSRRRGWNLRGVVPKSAKVEDSNGQKQKPKSKFGVRKEMGDSFSPLNDHSRLMKRNYQVQYFGDRKKNIFMRQIIWSLYEEMQKDGSKHLVYTLENRTTTVFAEFENDFDAMRLEELTLKDPLYKDFVKKWLQDAGTLQRAFEAVKYKPISGGWYVVRLAWISLSLGGNVNKAWATLTSSSYAMAITVFTSYLLQSQDEAKQLVNGLEQWNDVQKFASNACLMGAIVIAMLSIVQIINYLGYCWKSQRRILHEARFNYILERYREQDPTMPDYALDYNPDCDPDIAMMYFTLREEHSEKTGWSALTRLYQLCSLEVKDNLLRDMLNDEVSGVSKKSS